MRQTADGQGLYRCTNCGAERLGQDERAACCCGIRLKTGADAGIRCQRNPAASPEFPSEIVAGQMAAA